MRLTRHLKPMLLAAIGLALASSSTRTHAQALTTSYTNTFDTGGNTTPFANDGSVKSWIYWYNTPGTGSVTNDPTMDAGGDPNSGSLEVYSPFANTPGTQNVFFGTFGNNGGYDFSVEANLLLYSNISCDIHVATNMTLSANGDFGSLGIGIINANYGYQQMGSVVIPATATNGWVHLVVPVDKTQANLANVPGICFDYANYSGYPVFDMVFWIDNVAAYAPPGPPPPPPTISTPTVPVTGLNCIAATPGANGQYNRYQLATINDTGYSFVGAPSVTYSWTIKSYPTNTSFQQHFFIVNGQPGQYDQAADYNLADCIFFTVQENGSGQGVASFRYKTNQPAGNAMIFNGNSPTNTAANPNMWPIMPVCGLTDVSPVGTWSLTFANTTNVTITGPSGATTNFVFDAASAALFADPCTLILGAQPNNPSGTGEAVIYSSFSVTGNATPFSDNFLTDTNIDTATWKNLSNDTNGCVLVPQGSAYWVSWTLPDAGFTLQDSASLTDPTAWTPITSGIIKVGVNHQVLIAATNLPSAGQGFFQLVQRTFSQLQVLLPGETAAPGTATGKTGTPTAVSLNAGGYITVTVNAVDANWFPIPGVSDMTAITSSDGGAVLPNNTALVNGTAQISMQLETPGSQTITATDVTTPAIPAATSSSVVVGP